MYVGFICTVVAKVVHLVAAEGSEAGDRVHLEGSSASTDFPKVLKSDAWKKLAALLRVQGGKATFDGKPMATAKGLLSVPGGMPDGARVS